MNLSERAMLVNIKISTWTGRKKNKQISEQIQNENNASTDSGAWWTYLIPKKHVQRIETAANNCRTIHYKFSLPWLDGGVRILPSEMLMDYTSKLREAIYKFDEVIDDFISDYPEIKISAHKRLGTLIDGKEFPSTEELRSKFGVHTDILPLPDVKDFRVKINAEDAEEIKSKMKESLDTMTQKAVGDIWRRLKELVEKIETTMKDPKKIFRDTLIGNLSEFVDLIPKLNLTNDNRLEEMRKEVKEKLASLKPIDLRESKTDRKKAHKSSKEILDKLNDYTL